MKKTLILAALLVLTFLSASADESIKFNEAKKSTITAKVDGQSVNVSWFVDNYCTKPNRAKDQKINVYVPENATKQSPIIFIVNNGGWLMDDYPTNTIQDGCDYDGTNDKIGVALKEGYVVVSYGCRSRANGATDGKYLGHSPATMTDTKAAIRYLRYNREALPAGNTDRIIVTGTSGGGALSTVIAASGNSKDFYPSLYEIGAAGITKDATGTYSSEKGIGDNVFATISYCPITDLGHGDAAYEWQYQGVRKSFYKAGKMKYDYADEATIMKASSVLADIYPKYLNGLGLKDENGNALTSSNLNAFIERLMRREIELSIKKLGVEQMKKDVEQEIRQQGPMMGNGSSPQGGMPQGMMPQNEMPKQDGNAKVAHRKNNGWIVFNQDGTWTYDYQKHLEYVALYTTLKPAPAFSNYGLYSIQMNEDTLFGSETDEYCPFNPYSWNNDKVKNNVGKDDTGLSWDDFMQTEAGKALILETKMTCAMDYLLEDTSDTAPCWYVRHGMDDRDASWPVEATLFASIMNSPQVKAHNLSFAWLKPHSGDYDVKEAYAWLKNVLGD